MWITQRARSRAAIAGVGSLAEQKAGRDGVAYPSVVVAAVASRCQATQPSCTSDVPRPGTAAVVDSEDETLTRACSQDLGCVSSAATIPFLTLIGLENWRDRFWYAWTCP